MINTRQKDFDFIYSELKQSQGVFVIGCSDCATLAQTGGEKQVTEMKEKLEQHNIPVTGSAVFDVPCDARIVRKEFKKYANELQNADTLLVMACGAGIGAIRTLTQKNIIPALDSLHVGTTIRIGQFEEKCSLCGDCTVHLYAGYCVKTLCPKGLINGPCGGAEDGNCEVNPDNECVWIKIYKDSPETLLKLKDELFPPRSYRKEKR